MDTLLNIFALTLVCLVFVVFPVAMCGGLMSLSMTYGGIPFASSMGLGGIFLISELME